VKEGDNFGRGISEAGGGWPATGLIGFLRDKRKTSSNTLGVLGATPWWRHQNHPRHGNPAGQHKRGGGKDTSPGGKSWGTREKKHPQER